MYWIFTHDVYDGHQEDYGEAAERRLAARFPAVPEFAFVDELIESLVRRKPGERVQTAAKLLEWVQAIVARIEAGGRVLDLTNAIRCLFCGFGTYKPLAMLPPIEERSAPPNPSVSYPPDIYADMRDKAAYKGYHSSPGGSGSIGPLILVCEYCGNVQEFRLDIATHAAKNWKP